MSIDDSIDERIKKFNEAKKSYVTNVLLNRLSARYLNNEIDFLEFCKEHEDIDE
jgi:low affinity Fe/Cu permease